MVTLLPAVDIRGGRAAQVPPGAPDDALQVAERWVADGAQMLHLVDLDAAYRRGNNAALLASLVDALDVPVQLSGGIDNASSARVALATGASRINLASSALLDPDLVRSLVAEHGRRIVIGLDVRQGEATGDEVIARGSEEVVGPLADVVDLLASIGADRILVADASRDGSRRGVDMDMFRRVFGAIARRMPQADIIASGGVATLDDLRALRGLLPMGLAGVVLGSALHHGAFTVAQAAAALAEGRLQ